MNNDNLELIIGKPTNDPKQKAATFSRFVLPFAYRITKTDNNDDSLWYNVDPATNLSFIKRRKYFSHETALVLYNRGTWLKVCDNWKDSIWGKDGIDVILSNKEFNIKMLPPEILLFESEKIEIADKASILQTGFLFLDIYFPERNRIKPELDDLLMLNEYFRFFGIRDAYHAKQFNEKFGKIPIAYSLDKEIPRIQDVLKTDEDKIQGYMEGFFNRWAELLKIPIRHGDKTYKLLPGKWVAKANNWAGDNYTSPMESHWQVYADNRTYVWTAALLPKGAETLKKKYGSEEKWEAHKFGHWIKLLNVDNPAITASVTDKSTRYAQKWADERTYKRWEEGGTWYGYSYHSGAMLSSPLSYLSSVYRLQYFDATLLLFYIRITLFRFSGKLSKIVAAGSPSRLCENDKNILEQFKKLRSEFAFFSILYQTPLLSNQQQCLEMHEINKKYFEINTLFVDVKKEIDETHDLLEQMESQKLSTLANTIAKWGIPLGVGGVMTGLFGMSDFKFIEDCGTNCFSWPNLLIQGGIVIVISAITHCLVVRCILKGGQ